MLKINGVAMPSPVACNPDISDIDGETNRDANAFLHRDRVATKRKLNCEWGVLSASEASKLLSAVAPEFVEVTYFDPQLGTQTTKTMYAGDKNIETLMTDKNGNVTFYKSIKFNLVER